jgi:hypothetical protein
MKVYRIKPLEKKSISVVYEMYRDNDDGSISWFNIEDHYRWGQGFIEEDMDCNLPREDSDTAYCKNDCGWGAELEDRVACYFEFSDNISEEEQQAIQEAYYEGGASWLYDGEHEWQFEDDSIVIAAPFQIDLCEDDGTVIEENFKLKQQIKFEVVNNDWPFAFPNDNKQGN